MLRFIPLVIVFQLLSFGCAKSSLQSGLKDQNKFISANIPMIAIKVDSKAIAIETRNSNWKNYLFMDVQSPLFWISKVQPLMVDYIFRMGHEYVVIDLRKADSEFFKHETIQQFENEYEKNAVVGEIIKRGRLDIDGVQISYWDIVYRDDQKRRFFARYMAFVNSTSEMLQIRYSKDASPWEYDELLKVQTNQEDGISMHRFFIDDLNEVVEISKI